MIRRGGAGTIGDACEYVSGVNKFTFVGGNGGWANTRSAAHFFPPPPDFPSAAATGAGMPATATSAHPAAINMVPARRMLESLLHTLHESAPDCPAVTTGRRLSPSSGPKPMVA
ncbi:hypothetical protein Misp05_45410 [Micromonospora sp. NBRC 107095]|nr:hypothetical protein Misp05_45410 [Micromonospora sp. NBRC 107095]